MARVGMSRRRDIFGVVVGFGFVGGWLRVDF